MTARGPCSNLSRLTLLLVREPMSSTTRLLMQYKTLALCGSAMVLAVAIACSKTPDTPIAPSSSQPGAADAAADGSTLKVTAPTPQSPVNNAQPDTLVLTTGRATPTFGASAPMSYEFEIKTSGGANACAPAIVDGGSGSTV